MRVEVEGGVGLIASSVGCEVEVQRSGPHVRSQYVQIHVSAVVTLDLQGLNGFSQVLLFLQGNCAEPSPVTWPLFTLSTGNVCTVLHTEYKFTGID